MIKNWSQFNEISGTELVGAVGPAYGDTKTKNKTISNFDTDVIYSDVDGRFYTIDDYNTLYNEYIKKMGKPLAGGYCLENIDKMIIFMQGES